MPVLGSGRLASWANVPAFQIVSERIISFIWTAAWQKKRDNFHLLVHSHCNGQGWTSLKPGALNSLWISHVNGRCPSTWAIFYAAFPGALIRSLIWNRTAKTQTGWPCPKRQLTLLQHNGSFHSNNFCNNYNSFCNELIRLRAEIKV